MHLVSCCKLAVPAVLMRGCERRNAPEKLQPAVYLHLALADLGQRYHTLRRNGTIKLPLS